MKRRTRDTVNSNQVALTPAMVSGLRAQREKTGVGVPELVRHLDPSFGVTERRLHSWLLGGTPRVRPDSYKHVLETWRGLEGHYVFSTPEILEEIGRERLRTDVGAFKIFKLTGSGAGVTPRSFVCFCEGRQQKIPRTTFEQIMAAWRALPDRSPLVALTPAIVKALRAHKLRTRKGPQALLAGARDRPSGLDATAAAGWLNGRSKRVLRSHLDYVLARYAACPDHQSGPTLEKLRSLVRRELRRTRITDDELRRMLGIERKRSWQFLARSKMEEALSLLRVLPAAPKPKRKGKPRDRLPWLKHGYFWEGPQAQENS
jgi:hypothetical protein